MPVQLSTMPTAVEAPAIERPSRINRIPRATYRLQLTESQGFEQIRELIPYFQQLGISDLYLSPLFRARAGSTHGYDVVDHGEIEPAFGGEAAFVRLAEEVRAAGMGIILDVVPNHMGINDSGNRYWLDVLENGEGARWARFFDIDWDAIPQTLKHRVLQPVLGRPFGAALEQGELRIVYAERRLQVEYFDRLFPLAPRTWPAVLELVVARLAEQLHGDAQTREASREARVELTELESIIAQLRHLPPNENCSARALRERYREQRIARRRLAHLAAKRPRVADSLTAALEEINGVVGQPSSFDRLEELLRAQCYRLAYWRVASDEINYRRFFDINELAAIRVEDPQVFELVHRLVGSLLERDLITGLRIDHPDGLLDPAQYFENLQSLSRRARAESSPDATGEVYIVAEKILSGSEQLPTDWAVHGTTGYEFINQISRLLVDADGVNEIRAAYEELSGVEESAAEIFYESKKEAASVAMLSEMQMLASRLYRIAQRQRASRDFTQPTLLRALQEVLACLAVYRTYVPPRGWEASEEDHRRIGLAVRWAKRRNPSMSRSLFDFIASVLLLQFPTTLSQEDREAWRHFALKLQQVSGPIAAKGVEDTAFYRYYPLASLNEGRRRTRLWRAGHRRIPSTHAPPRDDVAARARPARRLTIPSGARDVRGAAPRAVGDSAAMEGFGAPVAADEPPLSGTLGRRANPRCERGVPHLSNPRRDVAAGADGRRRSRGVRRPHRAVHGEGPPRGEAPHVVDESVGGLRGACVRLRAEDPRPRRGGVSDRPGAVRRRDRRDAGFVNSLSQVLLKATLPGAPDFYQGTEQWDFRPRRSRQPSPGRLCRAAGGAQGTRQPRRTRSAGVG
jgi:(1->4)-alpha-D-glucan 1-alpha-D-glucosylmutase